MTARFITGDCDDSGRLFAAWDPDAHHVEPGVRGSKFAAFLSPFRTLEDAERALLDAGAVLGGTDGG